MADTAITGARPVFDPDHQWPRWPISDERDEQRVLTAMRGSHWGIGSPEVAAFAREFADYSGAAHALPVGTGTAALALSMRVLGVAAGDEVIVPAYTFIASATCALELGATVLFADIDPETYNIAPASVAALISDRTRAVIAVHFAGNPCDMDGLRQVIGERDIAIVEDAAHAHGMRWRGRHAGTIGVTGCFSFQTSKNMTSGEGGMFTTNDPDLYALAESFHSFGRRPGSAWYDHYTLAWNHRLSGIQAAILSGQLERLEAQTAHRFATGNSLNRALATIAGMTPQRDGDTHAETRRAYHLYMWRYDAAAVGLDRATFIEALNAEGVPAVAGYSKTLQDNPMFTERRYWPHHRFGGTEPQADEPDYTAMATPVASQYCDESIWLTQNILLAPQADIDKIAEAVDRVVTHAATIRDRRG